MRSSLPAQPDVAALDAFVRSRALRAPDGRILSWLNPDKPGYPYDEITAVYARLFRWLGDTDSADALVTLLEQRLEAGDGLLARAGVRYVFDSALLVPLLEDPAPLSERLLSWLEAGHACAPVRRPGWWSESVGAHQIKAAALIGARPLAAALAEGCFEDGRFRVHRDSELCYLHSHCYALEGLYLLDLEPEMLRAGCEWLAAQQSEEGDLPAFHGPGAERDDRRPSDALAQALRLWALVDAEAFASPIMRARRALATRQDPHTGGIYYTPRSADLNSWASAFALQALRWADAPPDAAHARAWLL